MNKEKTRKPTAAGVTLALVSVIIASMSVTISFITPIINVPLLIWTIVTMFATTYLFYREMKKIIIALNF